MLATTGKIDRAGLRMLREEIERARRAGMIGQQLARFASGRIRQSPEQISVTQMLRDVLLQRGREATARQIEIRQALKPAEVVADATLLLRAAAGRRRLEPGPRPQQASNSSSTSRPGRRTRA